MRRAASRHPVVFKRSSTFSFFNFQSILVPQTSIRLSEREMKVELRLMKQVAEKCHSKLARMTTFSHHSFPRDDLGDCDDTRRWPSSAPSGGVKKEAIRKGHFAVVAASRDGEVKRFVIALSCLRNPAFLRLLDEAEEEFGWSQQGVLSVLCRPSELEDILAEHRQMESREQRWS